MQPYSFRQKRQRPSAQNRIVFLLSLTLLLGMIILGLYMAYTLYHQAYEGTLTKMQIYTERTAENLDQSFAYVTNTALAVATSETVLDWFYDPELFSEINPDYYKNVYRLKKEVNHILTYSNAWRIDYIRYIAVFSNEKPLVYAYRRPIAENQIWEEALTAIAYAAENQQPFVSFIRPENQRNQIYHIREMKHNFAKQDALRIVIVTDEEALRRQYEAALGESFMSAGLINEQGHVFSAYGNVDDMNTHNQLILAAAQEQKHQVTLSGESYLFIHQRLESAPLTLISLVPQKAIINQTLSSLSGYIIISLILCLGLLLIGIFISFRSTRFIRQLAFCMEKIKNKDYDARMPNYHTSAVNELGQSFNQMAEAMKLLIRDTYESRLRLQATELEFLQQQMNPHFLFNILLTMQIKAKLSQDETMYQMLTSLSGFLRAGLYANDNPFTSLGEELRCTGFYLYLQKQRFGENLHYQIAVEEKYHQVKIPRLSLQPLVENAVVHGGEGLKEPLQIKIYAEAQANKLLLLISDNGVGFDSQSFSLESENVRNRVGLYNTHQRFLLLYGADHGLRIESQPGHGTMVQIVLPLVSTPQTEQ